MIKIIALLILGLHWWNKNWMIASMSSKNRIFFVKNSELNREIRYHSDWNFQHLHQCYELMWIDILGIEVEIILEWMSGDFVDRKSTLFQVMAWCRQPPSAFRQTTNTRNREREHFSGTYWLPTRWASGFSGGHQQNHQCLWFPSYYVVSHVCGPSWFEFCLE